MRSRQLTFDALKTVGSSDIHGGNLRVGKRKTARPLALRKAIHVVMRSKRAKGQWYFLNKENSRKISSIINEQSRRHGVRVEKWVNVGNHLHLCIRGTRRQAIQNFLRTVPALIARAITGAHRGRSFGKFWDGPVFTRIYRSSFAEWRLRKYLSANSMEIGFGRWARELFWSKPEARFGPDTIDVLLAKASPSPNLELLPSD